ncbi:MAG TPA: ferrous iron transporter B [Patescibacteria group bacterium]|nr:ferrous iron transporter B [Patescibacteria group bacterium]
MTACPAPAGVNASDAEAHRAPAVHRHGADLPVVALVGRPNVGKSTFLARASGRFAETTNAPGTTVGREIREVRTRAGRALLVDLPGTASLTDHPMAGPPFWTALLSATPDAILVVIDAGDVARHLPLVLACRDLGLPVVVALNLADEAAAHGIVVDAGRLGQILAVPVRRTVARTGNGVAGAVALAVSRARRRRGVRAGTHSPRALSPAATYPPDVERALAAAVADVPTSRALGAAALDPSGLGALVAAGALSPRGAATILLPDLVDPARRELAARWAAEVEDVRPRRRPFADRLAGWSIRPWPGLLILAAVLAVTFTLVSVVGAAAAGFLSGAWATFASPVIEGTVRALVPIPALASALLWGLDSGILGLLAIGIPYVLLFYLLIATLEDSGYLTSLAVLTDRVLGGLGLSGRTAIPLLAATGCNVPAIYATRVLATRRERVLASFLVTLVPCSARSAVVVAALMPFAGPAVTASAFALIVGLTLAAGIAANAMLPGRQSPLVMELAPLRRPLAGQVRAKATARFRGFVRMAAPVMIVGSIVLGLFYETGLIWPAAVILDPVVVGWLGLPSVAGLALAFAFLRKELALQLLLVLAAATVGAGVASIGDLMTPGQLFVYAIVTSVSVPCVATLAALAGELGWRTAIVMAAATLGLAIGVGGVLARLLGVA